MNTMTNDQTQPAHHRGPGRKALILLAILIGGAVTLLWGWNTLAADFAGLPKAGFRHALAFELSILALAWTAGLAFRWRLHD
jgi:hypothetical protein